jgi:23S rRNA (adenine2503-C2)-methyltransferase
MKKSIAISSQSQKALEKYVIDKGFQKFRAAQILHWVFQKRVSAWSECQNLPAALISVLAKDFVFSSLELSEVYSSAQNDSFKYLFKAEDGALIETVLIHSLERFTLCLSTQVGCRFSCSFCASGKHGFIRDLLVEEIIDQICMVTRHIERPIDNIVFMGMGEPLDNYEATLGAIRTTISAAGFGLSPRRITVSTVGLLPALKDLSKEDLSQIKISISLHSAIDEKRACLMPIAKQYSVKELVHTIGSIRDAFKRTLTLEYILIRDFNDSKKDSDALIAVAKKLKAKVNIIGYNPIEGCSYSYPSRQEVDTFKKRIEKARIPVTVRYSAGADISAACGQLRLKKSDLY